MSHPVEVFRFSNLVEASQGSIGTVVEIDQSILQSTVKPFDAPNARCVSVFRSRRQIRTHAASSARMHLPS